MDIKTLKSFKDRLRWIRRQRELTQGDLAKLAKVTPAAVGNWENREDTKPTNMGLLAHVLGVEALWLESGEGPMRKDSLFLVEDKSIRYADPNIGYIRRANLELLMHQMGGIENFSESIGIGQQKIWEWLHLIPDEKGNAAEKITATMCRSIERSCGKELGWLDSIHIGEKGKIIEEIQYDKENFSELPAYAKRFIESFVNQMIEEYFLYKEEPSPSKKIDKPQLTLAALNNRIFTNQ